LEFIMSVTLTIKQVPDELAAQLRALAARNHRSLQGELLHTLETRLATQEDIASTSTDVGDDLLAKLDAVVAGSHWGEAPFLGREHANDRTLFRETEHRVQETVAEYGV
jgi:plasmid stability protein